MKLIDMKKPKKTKKQLEDECKPISCSEGDQYPYGLRINLDKEQIGKITGLDKLPAGATVNIQAVGKIMEVRITDSEKDKTRHSIEIQIQKIGITGSGKVDQDFAENAFNKAAGIK